MSKAIETNLSEVDELDGDGCMNLMDAIIARCFTIPQTNFKKNYFMQKAFAENSPALHYWCLATGYNKKKVQTSIIKFNKRLMEYSEDKLQELRQKQKKAIFLEYIN